MARTWKPCSSCKKPIPVGGRYYKCSVSTCNRVRDPKAFCSMACWDAHVPVMAHRSSAWATEERAPTSLAPQAPAGPPAEADRPAGRRRVARAEKAEAPRQEILVVASRLKDFVRAESGFKTSSDVLEVLSDHLRLLALEGIEAAREDGRRTVKARDLRRPGGD